MADPLFPAKRSIFVKTYSKVRPLQTVDSDPPKLQNTCGATPILRTGKPFPYIQPANAITPTLAPANSPSSDTSSTSETPDVEMVSTEVDKKLNTEEEDEKSFVTLIPGSKKTSKKQRKQKSYSPLKNISNVIKVLHPSKPAPKPVASPFMWTCTKLRPQGQLASIQESDQESSSSEDQEYTLYNDSKDQSKDQSKGSASNRHSDRLSTLPQGPLHSKKLDRQDTRAGTLGIPAQNQKRGKGSPMIVEGRGMFSNSHTSTATDQRSTQMYGSQTGDYDGMSTVTYTRQTGETTDESTIMISDVTTDDNYCTTTDTSKDEDYSDIEILRDFPGPTTRVMQHVTPTVANLMLPEATDRRTRGKTAVSTAKAMPKKHSGVWNHRKPTVKSKNSTLVEGRTALTIQQYAPIEEISDIKEDNSGTDLDPNKKTSTPSSKGRNTMLHPRFIPEVSSIEGDACAMPTIDAMQSLTSTSLADKISTLKLAELRPVTAPSETKGPAPRSVYSISASSDEDLPPGLSVRGKRAFAIERASPRMSPRLSFGQYPKTATKMTSHRQKKASTVSAENQSRNSSSKHVKFLLSNKAHEVLPERDPSKSLSIVNLPELSPSSSILKKRETTTAVPKPSVTSKTEDQTKPSSKAKQETKSTERARMTSTPQKRSRRSRGTHMMELSFDVSSVDLPSCSENDMVIPPSIQTDFKTSAVVTDVQDTLIAAGQSTLMGCEPIPMQASASIRSKRPHQSHPACATPHKQEASKRPAPATQGYPQEAQHPSIATPEQHACQLAEHPLTSTGDQLCQNLQEAKNKKSLSCIQATSHQEAKNPAQGTQHPVHGTQHPPHGSHDEFNTQWDCHPVSATDDVCSPNESQQLIESRQEAEHSSPCTVDLCIPQGTQHPVRGTQHPEGSTLKRVGTKEAQHPVHTTPRSQLKRSSPNGDLPGRPNKKKFLQKDASDEGTMTPPQTCDRATQKDLPIQQRRLDYVDKAVGLPQCIIARLGPTPHRPAKFRQYIDAVNLVDYDKIKNLPQDIFETIPDAVFS